MSRKTCLASAIALVAVMMSTVCVEPALAVLAFDDASQSAYNDGWASGDNGGSGFLPWSLTTDTFALVGIGTSTNNGNGDGNADGDIDTAGRAWKLNAGGGNSAIAVRGLVNPLGVLETLSLALDNGAINNGSVGLGLQNAAGVNLFEFSFTGGGSGWEVDAQNISGTLPGYSDEGMLLTFSLIDADSFTFTVDRLENGVSVDHTVTGDLLASVDQSIAQLRVFNNFASTAFPLNDGSALYINSLSISAIPEASTILLGSLVSGLLGLGAVCQRLRNRRRSQTIDHASHVDE